MLQTVKNIHLFLDVFVLVLIVLIHLNRPVANLGASSGCDSNVTEIKAVLVSVVSIVSVFSSFRPFRFVVSGFSTCPVNLLFPPASFLPPSLPSLLPAPVFVLLS